VEIHRAENNIPSLPMEFGPYVLNLPTFLAQVRVEGDTTPEHGSVGAPQKHDSGHLPNDRN
jgi:hypothetical protein